METIRLRRSEKIKLEEIKKRTGIENWNVLCRWALCLSLSNPDQLNNTEAKGEPCIEMTWQVFSGGIDLYDAILFENYRKEEFSGCLQAYVYSHLIRGIETLAKQKTLSNFSLK